MNNKIIICNGDSWTWGSEIINPDLLIEYPKKHTREIEQSLENDDYRVSRNWPTQSSKKLNTRVINLGRVADDNNAILNRTINFVLQGLQNKMFDREDLVIIHGWTTPERREFWYRNPNDPAENFVYRLSPHGVGFPEDSDLYKFWKLYVKNFWNPEEYIIRNLMTMISFENFCKANSIKFLHFNAFYQKHNKESITDGWRDISMMEELKELDDSLLGYDAFSDSNFSYRQSAMNNFSNLWKEIDHIRHYNKDQPNNTFKSFIQDPANNVAVPFNGWHPSPEGHEVWADELIRYAEAHDLW